MVSRVLHVKPAKTAPGGVAAPSPSRYNESLTPELIPMANPHHFTFDEPLIAPPEPNRSARERASEILEKSEKHLMFAKMTLDTNRGLVMAHGDFGHFLEASSRATSFIGEESYAQLAICLEEMADPRRDELQKAASCAMAARYARHPLEVSFSQAFTAMCPSWMGSRVEASMAPDNDTPGALSVQLKVSAPSDYQLMLTAAELSDLYAQRASEASAFISLLGPGAVSAYVSERHPLSDSERRRLAQDQLNRCKANREAAWIESSLPSELAPSKTRARV